MTRRVVARAARDARHGGVARDRGRRRIRRSTTIRTARPGTAWRASSGSPRAWASRSRPVSTLEWGELGAERHPGARLPAPARRSGEARRVRPGRRQRRDRRRLRRGQGRDAGARPAARRGRAGRARTRYYEGRMCAPIANARGDHPLAREVGEVVTNHPAVLTSVEGADVVVALRRRRASSSPASAAAAGSSRSAIRASSSTGCCSSPATSQLAANILRLARPRRPARAHAIVLLRGDVLDVRRAAPVHRRRARRRARPLDRRSQLLAVRARASGCSRRPR